MKKEMSTIDAFIALRDMDDDDIVIPAKRKRVHEGFSYSVGDPKDMQAAEEKLNEETTKDVALEVIDVDADAVEHLKDNKEYVGQYIVQCNTCKRTKFIDGEDLKQAEGNESLYNVDDECPYCHSTDTGYTLVGQVGAVSKEDEAKASNDSLTDEPKFENDEPVESGEEVPEEEAPVEEEPLGDEEPMEEEPEEMSGDETETSEAEVEDAEDFGSSINLDDVEADDTEEAPEEEEAPVEEAVEELPEEEPKKKRLHLRFKESFANEFKFSAFMDLLVDPEVALQEIEVVNKKGQTLFRGTYDELPSEILDGNITTAIFGPKETAGFWTIYVCDQKEADCTVTEILDILGQPSQVELWDDETLETIFSGSRSDIEPDDLKLGVASIECPRYLTVGTNDLVSSEIQEESFDNTTLAARICEANGLKAARIDVAGSEEFYIHESIEQLEDLRFTYNHYVKNCNEDIIREYKKVTGYKTLVDEAAEEETLADVLIDDTELTESKGDDENVAVEQANELLKNSGAFAVIYGFGSGAAFKAIDPIICKDSDQLKDKTEILTLRYKPQGSIRVTYKKNESLKEAQYTASIDGGLCYNIEADSADEVEEMIKDDIENLDVDYNIEGVEVTADEIGEEQKERFYKELLEYQYEDGVPETFEEFQRACFDDIGFVASEEDYKVFCNMRDGVHEGLLKPASTLRAITDANESLTEEVDNNATYDELERLSIKANKSEAALKELERIFRKVVKADITLSYDRDTNEYIYRRDYDGSEDRYADQEEYSSCLFGELTYYADRDNLWDKISASLSESLTEAANWYDTLKKLSGKEEVAESVTEEFFNTPTVGDIIDLKLDELQRDPDYDLLSLEDIIIEMETELDERGIPYTENEVREYLCEVCGVCESFKTRKELAAAITECRNNKQPYSIRRSLKEGYRYDLIKEAKFAHIDDGKVTFEDEPQAEVCPECGKAPCECKKHESVCPKCGKEVCECNKVTEAFDIESLPVDEESFFAESLTEAKKDDELDKVTDSMEKIETVIDLVQDEVEAVDGYTDAIETLDGSKIPNKEEIISKLHHIKGEELEHLDELKEVEALMPNVGELAEEPEVVAEPEVEKLPEEPEQLPELPEEPVEELPADDVAEEGAAVEESLKESDELTDDIFEINPTGELMESINKPEDVKSFELRKQTLENESEEHLEKIETVDDDIQKTIKDTKKIVTPDRKDKVFAESFDELAFDNVVNEYLDNNYEDTYLFESRSGKIDENGMIIIEGKLIRYSDVEDKEIMEDMSFTLTPDSTLTESVNGEKASYKVTDSRTGGVFYF